MSVEAVASICPICVRLHCIWLQPHSPQVLAHTHNPHRLLMQCWALLGCAAPCPTCRDPVVLPFYHTGMGEVMPRKARVPRAGKDVHVVVGQPVDLSDLTCRWAGLGGYEVG